MIELFPIAEADVITLMKSINRVVINPVIFFLFAVAMTYFLFGLSKYFLSPDNEEVRKQSKDQMIWGIIGLFIMVAVFGIMRIILNTFGVTNIKVQNNGDYTVTIPDTTTPAYDVTDKNRTEYSPVGNNLGSWNASTNTPKLTSATGVKDSYYIVSVDGTTVLDGVSNWEVGDVVYYDGTKWTKNNPSNPIPSASNPTTYMKPKDGNPKLSPFTRVYSSSNLCWREAVSASSLFEFKAREAIQSIAIAKLTASGSTVSKVDQNELNAYLSGYSKSQLPVPAETQLIYDPATKLYHFWWGAVAPINGGVISDCGTLPLPRMQSKKENPFSYQSYNLLSTGSQMIAIDSGVDVTLINARNIAIENALIQIALKKGLTSTKDIAYKVLDGKYYPSDSKTLKFDYWVVVQALQ